jgi:hypothetical protein
MGKEQEGEDPIIQGALFGADDRDPLSSSSLASSLSASSSSHSVSSSWYRKVSQADKSAHDRSDFEQSPHPIVTSHYRDQALWDDDLDIAPVVDTTHSTKADQSDAHPLLHRALPGIDALFGSSSSSFSSSASPSAADASKSRSDSQASADLGAQREKAPEKDSDQGTGKRTSKSTRKMSRRVRLFHQRFEEAEKGEHVKIVHRRIHDQPDTVGQGGRMVNREAQRSQLFSFSLLSEVDQQVPTRPLNETPLDIVYGSGSSHSHSSSLAHHKSNSQKDDGAHQEDRAAHTTRTYSRARWVISYSALSYAARGPYSFDFSLSYDFWGRLSTLIQNHVVILPDFTARRVLQQIGDPNLAQWTTSLSSSWTVLSDIAAASADIVPTDLSYVRAIGRVTGHQLAIIGKPEDTDVRRSAVRQVESQDAKSQQVVARSIRFVSLTDFMRQARGF